MRPVGVFVQAVRIGVTREVKPVPAPALAVLRAAEEVVDDGLESGFARIGGEGGGFFGRWRDADEIEIESAEEAMRLGWLGKIEPRLQQLLADEVVD